MSFLALFGGFLVKLLGSGIVAPVLSYLQQKDTTQRDIAVAQIGADQQRDQALLQAELQTNALRRAAQPEFHWLIILIVLGPLIHWTAVFLDSTPFWTPWGVHAVGSWAVPKAPAPYDDWEAKVLLSFFLLSPATALVRGVTTAIAKR